MLHYRLLDNHNWLAKSITLVLYQTAHLCLSIYEFIWSLCKTGYAVTVIWGHDTTASAISWILYTLAQHPEWQKKCQDEIDHLLDGRQSDDLEWWVSSWTLKMCFDFCIIIPDLLAENRLWFKLENMYPLKRNSPWEAKHILVEKVFFCIPIKSIHSFSLVR